MRLRRREYRVDQVVHGERGASAVDGWASLVDGVEELGDQRAVRFVWERHRIGAGARRRALAGRFAAAGVKAQPEATRGKRRGAARADDVEALREARIAGGGRIERSE